MSDYKERYPLWPSRNNRLLLFIAAWMTFGVIGGGAIQVAIRWLFDLVMDQLLGPFWSRSHADLWWTFFAGACMGVLLIGGAIVWNWREPKISNRE